MNEQRKRKPAWTFGLTLEDFIQRLRDYGLPSARNTVINWEKKGWVKFPKTPGGWRYFNDIDEIDNIIRALVKKRNEEIPIIKRAAAMAKGRHDDDEDDFTVKTNVRLE